MFLFAGLLGLLAVGGLAIASDVGGDPAEDEDIADLPEEETLDAGQNPVNMIDFSDASDDTILAGLEESDRIIGGSGDDQINGYGGDDVIDGAAGDDVLHGGPGDDLLTGGVGEDVLHGEDGADLLSGDLGADMLFGHGGDDSLIGGAGDDDLFGGEGSDQLRGDAGADALHGGLGDDDLDGGAGQDTLFGGTGDDVLSGRDPSDTGEHDPELDQDFLNGGDGNDMILAGEGDIVTAGSGEDTIVLGDWIAGGDAAQVMDFDRSEDALVIMHDLAGDPDPEIEVVEDGESPDLSHVLVNGEEIALVRGSGGLAPQDIILLDHAEGIPFGRPAA